IAVEDDSTALAYQQLYEKVSRLADVLIERGCATGMIVGVYADRSVDMMTGILAIFKVGAAYLPLDTTYPQERIQYMLEDSAAVWVLTQKKYAANLPFVKNSLFLDELPSSAVQSANTKADRFPGQLAYVIYSSGSTGKPKGVQVAHTSLYNFLVGHAQTYNNEMGPHDICAAITSVSFDASIMELFVPLYAGARLVMIPREQVYDVRALANILVAKQVTCCFLPPSLLPSLYSVLENSGPLTLNKLIVGAEPVKGDILRMYTLLNKNLQIVNLYGPTEATIASSWYKYRLGDAEGTNVSI